MIFVGGVSDADFAIADSPVAVLLAGVPGTE
jgi:hypothetical protein